MLSANSEVTATRIRTTEPTVSNTPPPANAAASPEQQASAVKPAAATPTLASTAPPAQEPVPPPPQTAAASPKIAAPVATPQTQTVAGEVQAGTESAADHIPGSAASNASLAATAVAPTAPPATAAVAPPIDADPLAGMPLPNLPTLPRSDTPENARVARADTTDLSAAKAADAATASADQTSQLAQIELKKAQDRIGLSDAQVAQLQQAQDKLAAGDNGTAFLLLQALNEQLQSETRSYVVQDGESLWHVAGQQEVYGNSYLWPLVWQANKNKVKQPYQLYKGLRLTIPAHPTVQEVAEALAESKANGEVGMRPAAAQ